MQMTEVRCRWLQEMFSRGCFCVLAQQGLGGWRVPFSFWDQAAAGGIAEQAVGAAGASGPGNNSHDYF